jgi:ABC-2 type transport system permease protein
MTGWAAIRLVAWREITQRARERSFLLSNAVSIVIVVLVAVLPNVLGLDGPTKAVVAAADPGSAAIAQAAARAADPDDLDLEVRVLDAEGARQALADEQVDVVLAGGVVRSTDEPDDEVVDALQSANAQVRATDALERAGVRGEALREVLAPPPLRVAGVDGEEAAQDDSRAGIAFIAVLALFGQLIGYGVFLAMGVVEEKTSRVVEVVLATIRPRELLAGKVLGLGVLGLGQLMLIAVLGLGAAQLSGAIELDGDVLAAALLAVAWFVVGYAFYASLFACAGALVPRQEELQSAMTPLTFTLLICYFVSFAAVGDPGGTLARVASFVPFTAPMTMPPRIVQGEAEPLEIVLALVLTVGAALLLVPVAARIYSGAVLRTGSTTKLRDAWRAAQTATR